MKQQRKRARPKRRFWTAREDAIMRDLYAEEHTTTIEAFLHRSVSSIYGRAETLGLNKSAAYAAELLSYLGRKLAASSAAVGNRFPKGHVPANKGSRRPGWATGRMKDSQFKKGQRNGTAAAHYMPLGAERLVDGYRYVKVAEVPAVPHTVNWKPLHVLNWERANGRPLPARHVLRFRDRNRDNVAVDNLELLTQAENMRRNTVHNLPKALVEVVRLRAVLMRKINRRTRDEKQD